MTTMTYVGELVVTSCWCGIHLAIPRDLFEIASRDHKHDIYCPLGHKFVYVGETEAAKYQRLYRAAQDRETAVRAERDQIEASRRAWKGQVTRLRKAAIEGDCPLCGQHLRDLARHVARIHPDEVAEIGVPEPTA